MTLGERIQQFRKGMGLSQEQLADIVGVSRQAVSKWETDQSQPELDKVALLSKSFSVSTDELLGNNQNSKNASQIESYIQTNLVKRLLALGWITSLTGAVLLVIELISLYFIKNMEIQSAISRGSEYQPDIGYYATQFPMSVIFIITAAVIMIGIVIFICSLLKKGRPHNFKR